MFITKRVKILLHITISQGHVYLDFVLGLMQNFIPHIQTTLLVSVEAENLTRQGVSISRRLAALCMVILHVKFWISTWIITRVLWESSVILMIEFASLEKLRLPGWLAGGHGWQSNWMGRAGFSTTVNKTYSKWSKSKNQSAWFTSRGCAWIGNLFTQKQDILLLILEQRMWCVCNSSLGVQNNVRDCGGKESELITEVNKT